MKKLQPLFVAILLAMLFSCKKNYYCVCTVHDSSGATPDTIIQQEINDTESRAKDECSQNSGTVGTITKDCILSE